jgi:hypothetical protein
MASRTQFFRSVGGYFPAVVRYVGIPVCLVVATEAADVLAVIQLQINVFGYSGLFITNGIKHAVAFIAGVFEERFTA